MTFSGRRSGLACPFPRRPTEDSDNVQAESPMYLKKKSIAGRISRVLYPLFRRASTIYLGRRSPARLVSNLPPDIGRATLQLPVYMVLQPARRTDRNVSPLPRWALTPPFHPYRPGRDGGRSLLRCYPLARIFPLGSAALCVARTFLPSRIRTKISSNAFRPREQRQSFPAVPRKGNQMKPKYGPSRR